jgi:hypothetical protein
MPRAGGVRDILVDTFELPSRISYTHEQYGFFTGRRIRDVGSPAAPAPFGDT